MFVVCRFFVHKDFFLMHTTLLSSLYIAQKGFFLSRRPALWGCNFWLRREKIRDQNYSKDLD